MKIVHSKKDKELTVRLCGELDENSAGYARLFFDQLTDDSSLSGVVIDMSELTFMDSTGIGVLIGRYKKLKPRGISMTIRAPSPTIDRVLGLSGIYNIMTKAG